MNQKEQQEEEYEAMQYELNNICKAINMVWRREQKKLVDEWLIKEDLK